MNDQLTGNLRVGAQIHTTKLGAFGSWVPGVDWALADYKVNRWIGVRAGKVKIRWGLYNDTQDADPGYLWSLLPESIYGWTTGPRIFRNWDRNFMAGCVWEGNAASLPTAPIMATIPTLPTMEPWRL